MAFLSQYFNYNYVLLSGAPSATFDQLQHGQNNLPKGRTDARPLLHRYTGFRWGSRSPINWLYWLATCGPQPLQRISVSWYRPMHHLGLCVLLMLRCSSFLAYTPNWPVALFLLLLQSPSTWNSTCWHSTVRKHSHFQTLFENPSVQAHLTSCAASSASIPENLTALYKSVIIVLWHIHCVSKTYAPWYLIITLANKDWYSKFFHQLIRKKILYMHIKKIST